MYVFPLVLFWYMLQMTGAFLQGSSASVQEIGGRCPHGQFPCNSSNTCVEQRRNCDGHADCEDGSDEMGCEDYNRKEYYNNLFRKRPDEDREKETQGCKLRNVPNMCTCSGYKLFCDRQKLEKPPETLPADVQELDLSGNTMKILEPQYFPSNENLQTLILQSAEVTYINNDAFKNLPNLRKLFLTKNQISALGGTMESNQQLIFLDLSFNPLSALSRNAFKGLYNLQELDLRECKLESIPLGVFDDLVNLKKLLLDANSLTSISKDAFLKLGNLEMLSLSRNMLQSVHMTNWFGLLKLRSMALSQNQIVSLESASFGNMSTLHKLDLHHNKIKNIDPDCFLGLPNLQSLSLEKNALKKTTKAVFEPLVSLEYIYFDDFHMCSLALHVRVCHPQGDGISSIAHLLDSVVLRVSVWLVAVVAGLGNAAVLIGRLLLAIEPNEVHSFYIKNLSLADLLMALYLFIIGAYDLVFRGHYIHHETHWRNSWQCNLCGFLATLSSEASILILTIITIDRYMSIMHPLSVKKRTLQSAAAAMAAAWGVAVLFSALPLLNLEYYGDEFYGNNGVCLPLQIHDPFGQAWEYSTFLFCGLNFAAFLFILFAYISMFFTISHSKIGLRCTQQQQDRNIAKRFAFIVATDFLCWVPIVFIKVIAMGGVPIQEDLYAWVAVFLLPVNSAINPILYTLTTKLFKQHLAKMVYNFKASTAGSGDSVTPSCARNHSLRSQKGSFSQADHNNIALVTGRGCPECRPPNFCRQKNSCDSSCRRHSSKRRTSTTNVV